MKQVLIVATGMSVALLILVAITAGISFIGSAIEANTMNKLGYEAIVINTTCYAKLNGQFKYCSTVLKAK